MKAAGFATILACLQASASAQPEGEDFRQTLLLAFLDPSAEYLYIYVSFALALLAIGVGSKVVLSKKGKVEDAIDDKSTSEQRSRNNATFAASNDPEFRNIDTDALFKELDQSGPYPCTLQGSLEPSAFFSFAQVVHKYAYMAYVPTKEKLLKERLNHLKEKRQKEYSDCIFDAAKQYKNFHSATLSIAIEFIGIDEQSFDLSSEEMSRKPGTAERLKQIESNVRNKVDKRPATTMTHDEIKRLMLEKIQMEGDIMKKMHKM